MSEQTFDKLTNEFFGRTRKLFDDFDRGLMTGEDSFMEFRIVFNNYASSAKKLFSELNSFQIDHGPNLSTDSGAALSKELINMEIMIAERFGDVES